ncbi:MAG: lipoyl synthase [Gammaproteobacteria bacterium]|nr:lipoyl synthase [Gammaproteobacteria bacterium]
MALSDIPVVTTNPYALAEKKVKSLRLDHDPNAPRSQKPRWIKAQLPKAQDIHRISELKGIMREQKLHSVCEEASCPNLPECFGHGTATFMILGDICTRKCPFCDVTHGRPNAPDADEPRKLAETVARMGLKYVVITSVDRDDLPDGGAGHFAAVIRALRTTCPSLTIEILTPDFRGCLETAVEILVQDPPDVFNHNLETVPKIYRRVRPGADYAHSLRLLQSIKQHLPAVPTKSGLMLGVGETDEELLQVLQDLRAHQVEWLTLGQYLQPTPHHLPVERYVTPEAFDAFAKQAKALGFVQVASGPMVRSSYHADLQAQGKLV